ncbi:MAG: glycosyltransferase family A protein, partial [Proteobacteria bacterium]|nr:glycosyltransferase family A protein [Pseudomonadota bacterium]
MAKVLILVPTYNQKREYLLECLKSIKNQTFKDFRCCILDDGSQNREETEALAKEYKFDYVWQENEGIGSIRNLGIKQIKDENFLCYISSDDSLELDYIQVMYNAAQEYPDTILYSNYYLMDENLNIIQQTNYVNYDIYEDFVMAVVESAKKNQMFVNYNLFAPVKLLQDCLFNPDK